MTACSPAVAPITTAGQLADRLTDGLDRQDSSTFASAFAASAAARSQADRWYALLSSAQPQLTAQGSDEFTVMTTLPGDRRPATEQLKLSWTGDGAAGFTVAAESRTPLWALEPATATSSAAGTVLTSAGDPEAQSWLGLLARAEAAVWAAEVVPEGSWSGRLVIEAPESVDDFALLTGSTVDTSAAVTSCRTGTPRIILNPKLVDFSVELQVATLTHEAVHVATDSACQRGLSWAVEGLAESVAAKADQGTAQSNQKLVTAYLATHPMPSALPEHPSTPTDYALAQLAADQVRTRLGKQAQDFFARATRDELSAKEIAQATLWYRQALRQLAG